MDGFWALFQEEEGATAVEYAVMLGLIIVVCFVAVATLGQTTSELWSTNNGQILPALSGSS